MKSTDDLKGTTLALPDLAIEEDLRNTGVKVSTKTEMSDNLNADSSKNSDIEILVKDNSESIQSLSDNTQDLENDNIVIKACLGNNSENINCENTKLFSNNAQDHENHKALTEEYLSGYSENIDNENSMKKDCFVSKHFNSVQNFEKDDISKEIELNDNSNVESSKNIDNETSIKINNNGSENTFLSDDENHMEILETNHTNAKNFESVTNAASMEMDSLAKKSANNFENMNSETPVEVDCIDKANTDNSQNSLQAFECMDDTNKMMDKECDAELSFSKEILEHNITASAKSKKSSLYESSQAGLLNYTDSEEDSADETFCDPTIDNNGIPSPKSSVPSAPSSPESLPSESAFHTDKREKSRSSKNSLPYFQLPDPDLDEYLAAASDVFLSQKKQSLLSFEDHTPTTKKSVLDEFLENFESEKSPHHLQDSHSKCVKEITRVSITSEYSKVLSCIGKMDDSKSPGIRRLALKEFLKKKIEEKKSAAFNRSKEMLNLENEELEYDEEIEDERISAESSDEDFEEQTVDLSPKKTDYTDSDLNEINTVEGDDTREREINDDGNIDCNTEDENSRDNNGVDGDESKKCNIEDENDKNNNSYDSESDDDILINKPRRPQVLEDDSSDSDDDANHIDNIAKTCFDDREKNNFSLKSTFLSENKSIVADISSYQPDAGLVSENSHDSFESAKYENEEKNLSDVPFHMSMDDPPIPLTGTFGSPMFLSQDLAAVCSGSFKSGGENSNKQTFVSQREKEDSDSFSEEPSKFKTFDMPESPTKNEKLNDFFDMEAELSGDDDGEDDPESDGDFEEIAEMLAPDEELPSNVELRDEIAQLHFKQLLHDDEDMLKEVKERFLDDGELHGEGRTRRFAWKNNGVDIDLTKDRMSSDSEDEAPADSWNQEKAKWREENKEEDLPDDMNSSYKTILKVKIVGKPEFSENIEKTPKQIACKRPRGSFLYLDNSSASQVLKKLKTSEEDHDGSRTTRHFVFRNEAIGTTKNAIESTASTTSKVLPNSSLRNPITTNILSNRKSIFTKI